MDCIACARFTHTTTHRPTSIRTPFGAPCAKSESTWHNLNPCSTRSSGPSASLPDIAGTHAMWQTETRFWAAAISERRDFKKTGKHVDFFLSSSCAAVYKAVSLHQVVRFTEKHHEEQLETHSPRCRRARADQCLEYMKLSVTASLCSCRCCRRVSRRCWSRPCWANHPSTILCGKVRCEFTKARNHTQVQKRVIPQEHEGLEEKPCLLI
jgi:hypothetical protein